MKELKNFWGNPFSHLSDGGWFARKGGDPTLRVIIDVELLKTEWMQTRDNPLSLKETLSHVSLINLPAKNGVNSPQDGTTM